MRKYLTINPVGAPPSPYRYAIEFTSAWDRTDEDYGVHGVEMRWYLFGPEGVVQFVTYTNWMLAHNRTDNPALLKPLPADVGYHSRVPMYEGQRPMDGECPLLDGDQCYYDGSGLYAVDMFETLVSGGSDAVWAKMVEYYEEVFGHDPDRNEDEW